MILTIDGSTTCTGFAFGGRNDRAPRGGVWKLPGADEQVFDRTLSLAYDSTLLLAQTIKAVEVCIEAPINNVASGGNAHTAMALIQLTGAFRAAAYRANCRVRLIAVSTVRKTFIGKGNLQKHEAKAAVIARCRQLGWDVTDSDGLVNDNRADANAVWYWAVASRYPTWSPQSTPLFGRTA